MTQNKISFSIKSSYFFFSFRAGLCWTNGVDMILQNINTFINDSSAIKSLSQAHNAGSHSEGIRCGEINR